MSTKELAYSIFSQLTDEELAGFVALFRNVHPPKNDDAEERRSAFERMKSLCKAVPNLDEKQELEEYREEKYGK